jgi:hypothetical protein
MAIGPERACLAIADVTGYTGYLAGVELDHAQDILADLIGTVVEAMVPFQLSKLEGDAAFALLSGEAVDGSMLQDMVEGTYVAFRKRLRDIRQASRCECNACVLIPQLDLKLIVHHGIVARQRIAGWEELVGSDVILVHRLLKNRVTDETGIAAYALYTQAVIEAAVIDPVAAGLQEHHEPTDVAGDVTGWVRDLEAVWHAYLERPRHEVPPEDVAAVWTYEVPVPPQVAWEYITSPVRRPQWTPGVDEIIERSPSGRRGAGTTNHCMHGKDAIIERILDWQPPTYWLTRSSFPESMGGLDLLMSDELAPLPAGATRVRSVVARADGTDRERFERVLPMLEESVSVVTQELRAALDEVARELAAAGDGLGVPRSEARHLTAPVTRRDADRDATRT